MASSPGAIDGCAGTLVDAATLHMLLLKTDDPGAHVEQLVKQDGSPPWIKNPLMRGSVFEQRYELERVGMPGAFLLGRMISVPGELPKTLENVLAGKTLGALVDAPDFLADRVIVEVAESMFSLKGVPGCTEMIHLRLDPMQVPLPAPKGDIQ